MAFDLSVGDNQSLSAYQRVLMSREDGEFAIDLSNIHPVFDPIYEEMDADGYTFESRVCELSFSMLGDGTFGVARTEMKAAGVWWMVTSSLVVGMLLTFLLTLALLFLNLENFGHLDFVGQILEDWPAPVPESLHQRYDDYTTVESHNIIGSRKPLIRDPETSSGFSVGKGYMLALVIGGAGLALLILQ